MSFVELCNNIPVHLTSPGWQLSRPCQQATDISDRGTASPTRRSGGEGHYHDQYQHYHHHLVVGEGGAGLPLLLWWLLVRERHLSPLHILN